MKTLEEVREFIEKNHGCYFIKTIGDDDRLFVVRKDDLGLFRKSSKVRWIEISASMFANENDEPFLGRDNENFDLYTGEQLVELLKRDFL